MPVALGLVLLEMQVMSWLVVEVDDETQTSPTLLVPTYGEYRGPRPI
jgi:hypothetical protein